MNWFVALITWRYSTKKLPPACNCKRIWNDVSTGGCVLQRLRHSRRFLVCYTFRMRSTTFLECFRTHMWTIFVCFLPMSSKTDRFNRSIKGYSSYPTPLWGGIFGRSFSSRHFVRYAHTHTRAQMFYDVLAPPQVTPHDAVIDLCRIRARYVLDCGLWCDCFSWKSNKKKMAIEERRIEEEGNGKKCFQSGGKGEGISLGWDFRIDACGNVSSHELRALGAGAYHVICFMLVKRWQFIRLWGRDVLVLFPFRFFFALVNP